jgi:hypothetical protein
MTVARFAALAGIPLKKRNLGLPDVNIAIMRTFVRLRQLLTTHEEFSPEARPTGMAARRTRHSIDAKCSFGFPTSHLP